MPVRDGTVAGAVAVAPLRDVCAHPGRLGQGLVRCENGQLQKVLFGIKSIAAVQLVDRIVCAAFIADHQPPQSPAFLRIHLRHICVKGKFVDSLFDELGQV